VLQPRLAVLEGPGPAAAVPGPAAPPSDLKTECAEDGGAGPLQQPEGLASERDSEALIARPAVRPAEPVEPIAVSGGLAPDQNCASPLGPAPSVGPAGRRVLLCSAGGPSSGFG
jgi:hypothetical protein